MNNEERNNILTAKQEHHLEPVIRPAQQRTLGDAVYESLSELIRTGELSAGQKLPAEVELCRFFDVSRPVVRRALARCREDGLVISRKGSGSYVSMDVALASSSDEPQRQLNNILYALEFRRSTEPQAAYYAALRRLPEALEEIASALDAFRHFDLGASRQRVDMAFHQAVAKASCNDHYLHSLSIISYDIDLDIHLASHLSQLGHAERKAAIDSEHQRIYQAIAEQDPDAAFQAMRRHLDHAQLRILARSQEIIRRTGGG